MAWFGTQPGFTQFGLRAIVIYWGIFTLLLLTTLYMVLLDFRYIRMEFKLGERELFEDTLGNEVLRKKLREAQNATRKPSEPDQDH